MCQQQQHPPQKKQKKKEGEKNPEHFVHVTVIQIK